MAAINEEFKPTELLGFSDLPASAKPQEIDD